jgi:hypothetical protein
MQLTTCVLVTLQFVHAVTDDYVQSSDPDDPVLQEALAAEGGGWRLTEETADCSRCDEHLCFRNCSEAIQTNGGCVAEGDAFYVIRMLVFCRRECRDYYQGVKFEHLPADIISHGGIGDFLDQPFGLKLHVCSLREGYTSKMMAEPIEFAKHVPEYLVPLVPALTRDGFKKVDIPPELYSSILNTRNRSPASRIIDNVLFGQLADRTVF